MTQADADHSHEKIRVASCWRGYELGLRPQPSITMMFTTAAFDALKHEIAELRADLAKLQHSLHETYE